MIDMQGIILFSLIAMRMTGFIILNPVFGRSNISAMIKAGLVMALSVNVFAFYSGQDVTVDFANSFAYGTALLIEFFVGYVIEFVMNLFFSVVSYVGSVIDISVGLSMATVYDPQTRLSVSLNSNLLNMFMVALFFVTDAHLILFRIVLDSGRVVPFGGLTPDPRIIAALLDMFIQCTKIAIRLTFPMIAIQLIVEVGVGVLMKMIPQIDVFIVNIQLKIMIGLFVLLILVSPMGEAVLGLIDQMTENVGLILNYL